MGPLFSFFLLNSGRLLTFSFHLPFSLLLIGIFMEPLFLYSPDNRNTKPKNKIKIDALASRKKNHNIDTHLSLTLEIKKYT